MADIVGWPGSCLHHDAHDPSDELDVRRKRPERPENRRDAQLWMVESLAKHLDLDNAVH